MLELVASVTDKTKCFSKMIAVTAIIHPPTQKSTHHFRLVGVNFRSKFSFFLRSIFTLVKLSTIISHQSYWLYGSTMVWCCTVGLNHQVFYSFWEKRTRYEESAPSLFLTFGLIHLFIHPYLRIRFCICWICLEHNYLFLRVMNHRIEQWVW